ncbi:hypothetical protein IFM89_024068 [Coptis chinensis]|uniref:Uncharacterized protein n=1 Tax=Coptis chinensis TaxID=261450 RepID=A0A835LV91_9MAGN|nr:hypothetical protein IFM89_024068 [Coptis chinensis]
MMSPWLVGCVSSELRYLSSDSDLWKQSLVKPLIRPIWAFDGLDVTRSSRAPKSLILDQRRSSLCNSISAKVGLPEGMGQAPMHKLLCCFNSSSFKKLC